MGLSKMEEEATLNKQKTVYVLCCVVLWEQDF